MFKRISPFLITNFLFLIMISILSSLFGITGYLKEEGIDYFALMIICVVWGFTASFLSLAFSRMAAKFFMGVKVISPTEESNLKWVATMVGDLAMKAGIPTPETGVFRSEDVNAFATGPTKNRSLVAFSSALLQQMDRDAIEGVAAHEIAHIKNGDMVTMTLLQGVVNAFVMFFSRIVANVLSSFVKNERGQDMLRFALTIVLDIAYGFLGMMVTGWFSRQREFRADKGSAELGSSAKMIKALEALKEIKNRDALHGLPGNVAALGITNKKGFFALVSTHPPLEDRIAALR